MSSVKTIPLAGAPPSTRFTLKIAFSTTPARESIVAVTKSTASRARSKLLTLNSDISQLPSPRNRAMAGWSAGYQAAQVRRQLTPGPISSSPGTAGLPPFISFRQATVSWTLPCDILCVGLANGGSNISRSLKLLCLKRNIENLSAIQEKSGYLLGQRGNERFVGYSELIVTTQLSPSRTVNRKLTPYQKVREKVADGKTGLGWNCEGSEGRGGLVQRGRRPMTERGRPDCGLACGN